jgi:dTDP-4-amino-4,6-dideoxygalactose transaminase
LAGIETGIHYPVPVHLQKAYAGLEYEAGDLPVSETAADEFFSLPIYAEMQPDRAGGGRGADKGALS